MATTTIECPACHALLDLHYGINVGPEIIEDKNGRRSIEPGINFHIKHIEPTDTMFIRVLEGVNPYIEPGLEISELTRILKDEFKLCQVHMPMMIDRIKDAYNLYSPDGHILEIIK